jgi:LysM repeat protein
MKSSQRVFVGLVGSLLSVLLILAGFLMAVSESGLQLALSPGEATPSLPVLSTLHPNPSRTASTTPTLEITWSPSPTIEPSVTASPTPPATAVSRCDPPEGWQSVFVHTGDSLADIAHAYGISTEGLIQANCLSSETLDPGSLLYVPAPPPAAEAAVQCGPPARWVVYTVRSGDTLYRISRQVGATVTQLQQANCLGGSTSIRTGQQLYVPRLPVIPTSPPTAAPIYSPTPLPSLAPSDTALPTATTEAPTSTPAPTATAKIEPSSTPITPEPPDTPDYSPTPPPTPTPTLVNIPPSPTETEEAP